MEAAWKENELNEVECCPKYQAKVSYGDLQIKTLGQVVTPTQVQDQPTVSWESCDPSKLYAVFMTDPDAPSRKNPTFREWYHWGVVNIPGDKISEGDVVAQYVGSGPPEKTGLHRYVFLIYEQKSKVDTPSKLGMSTNNRGGRKIRDIVASYNLTTPIAGSCYQAEYDDYVPKLMKKLTS